MTNPIKPPAPQRRFSRFDLWVYRLFFARWNQHFIDYPDLRESFLQQLQGWHEARKHPQGKLALVSPEQPFENGPQP